MNNNLSWDQYFMNIAKEVAKKSKDPSSKCGCVIVDDKHRAVSFGYNGLPQGVDESKLTLKERPMKYYFVTHAEINAVLFARQDLTGCTVYNNVATCADCLKYCLQAGIRRFVYDRLRVFSHNNSKKSMSNLTSDEAIIRLLLSAPEVETLNIKNGKTYIEDILDSYEKDSPEYQQLTEWLLPNKKPAPAKK